MEKYKLYIIGFLLLMAGMVVGWIIKSTNSGTHTVDSPQHISDENSQQGEIWTCSMHPQIRQSEPGICPICEMDLIPVDDAAASNDPTILKMSKAAAKLAQVETTTIGGNQAAQLSVSMDGIMVDGTIEIDERTINTQTAHVGGRIENMYVTFEGQYVKTGQKIATLYSTDLLAATEELITASNFDDRIDGLKEASIQKLQNWKITDEQIQNILTSKKPLATMDIYADQSGYVLKKVRSQGDYIRQGESFYTVGKTGSLWVIFDVFESDLARVKLGQEITFTTASVPGKIFKSNIRYINPLLDSNTKTASVRTEINNSGNLLKPGMLIRGEIGVGKQSNATGLLTIPNSAILWTGEMSVVYVQLENKEIPAYQFREVKVENRGSNYSTISSGLTAGERIVTNGAFAIDAAAQLKNNFSMMNREVSIVNGDNEELAMDFSSDVTQAFLEQLEEVVNEYLHLKNALVETNSEETANAATQLLVSLEKVNMMDVTGDGHEFWMDKYRAIKAHTEKIQSYNSDVEAQRNQFDFLSEEIISMLHAFGTNNKEYFVQFCPMAKDDQGANWISTENVIRNPYFGDKMMSCGVVKRTLN